MTRYLFCCYLFLFPAYLRAQGQEANPSAYGPGPIVSTAGAPWALFRNMAGLIQSDKPGLVLSYQLPYNLIELQAFAVGFIIPWEPVIGISFYQSGTATLINQQFSLSTALEVGGISLGLRVKYWHLTFSGFRKFHLISVSTGIQTDLTEKLLLGVFIGNLSQSRIHGQETLPITLYTGLKYHPIIKLELHFEVGYNQQDYLWETKLGIEYQIKNKFSISTGYNGSSRQGHLGLGFSKGSLKLDYALGFHPYLGITQQAGLNYRWR